MEEVTEEEGKLQQVNEKERGNRKKMRRTNGSVRNRKGKMEE